MKTVEITQTFTGYPNEKDKRVFTEGEEAELSNDYADLVIGKGLAREKVAPPTTKAAAAKAKD